MAEKKTVDKSVDRKSGLVGKFLLYGFWAMLILFVLNILVSFLKVPVLVYIIEGLFYLSVFFVFINAVISLAPQGKSLAVIALIISSIFVLFVLLMVVMLVLSAASTGAVI